MYYRVDVRFRILVATLAAVLALAACAGQAEEVIETGLGDTPCKVVDGVPLPPSSLEELTDAASIAMASELAAKFKTNTGVAALQAVPYVTQANFNEIVAYYNNLLWPGWEYRQDLVEQIAEGTAGAAAWSSCIDERVVLLFFEDLNPQGRLLVALYTRP